MSHQSSFQKNSGHSYDFLTFLAFTEFCKKSISHYKKKSKTNKLEMSTKNKDLTRIYALLIGVALCEVSLYAHILSYHQAASLGLIKIRARAATYEPKGKKQKGNAQGENTLL